MKRRPRHVPSRLELVARLPRLVRPVLSRDQKTDLEMVHLQNLDAIARGQADFETLRQWAGGVMTWLKVAQLLQAGVPEMEEQQELAMRVVARYGRTGKVGFSGTDYQLAKKGVTVMDELAHLVDQPTASIAAEWSEAQLALIGTPETVPVATTA